MNRTPGQRPKRGFVLILTLALLGLLVLAVLALSGLVRAGGQLAATGVRQMQARQNALLGLNVALGELQRRAGEDNRVTAMAGVTGIGAGAGNVTRHWCGVWTDSGDFLGWLSSGAQAGGAPAIQAGVPQVKLAADGSVGANSSNSEHVMVGKLPITVPDVTGSTSTGGRYAYWVADEGVKVSAYTPENPPPISIGVTPRLFSSSATSAQGRLLGALTTYSARLPRILAYEQLRLLPVPTAAALTAGTIHDNFHQVTLSSLRLTAGELRSGVFNLNTNSTIVWRSIVGTYNLAGTGPLLDSAQISGIGAVLANGLAGATAANKATGGPFLSVDGFAGSALLAGALNGSGVTPGQFITGLGLLLGVRSDTFRIRAYGEALNPADPAKTEAVAYCEAIVQRMPGPGPGGTGRRFAIIHFRWLAADAPPLNDDV